MKLHLGLVDRASPHEIHENRCMVQATVGSGDFALEFGRAPNLTQWRQRARGSHSAATSEPLDSHSLRTPNPTYDISGGVGHVPHRECSCCSAISAWPLEFPVHGLVRPDGAWAPGRLGAWGCYYPLFAADAVLVSGEPLTRNDPHELVMGLGPASAR